MILHSDSGALYTAHEFQAFLNMQRMIGSLGSGGNVFNNAVVDRLFGLLTQRIPGRPYLTRAKPVQTWHVLYESTLL